VITQYSAITLVLERAAYEQLDRLPRLRVVPQMLAEGWGGTPSASSPMCAAALPQADSIPTAQTHDGEFDFRPSFGSTECEESRVRSPSAAPRTVRAPSRPGIAAKLFSMLKPDRAGDESSSSMDETLATTAVPASWLLPRVLKQLEDNAAHLAAAREQRLALADLALNLTADEVLELRGLARTQNLTWESAEFARWLLSQWTSDSAGEALSTLLRS